MSVHRKETNIVALRSKPIPNFGPCAGLSLCAGGLDMMTDSGPLIRLINGDAIAEIEKLPPNSIGSLIADPPYASGGIHMRDRQADPVNKYVVSESRDIHVTFAGDTLDQRSYYRWSLTWLSAAHRVLRPGALAFVFIDWRQLPVLTDALQAAGFIWRGVAVWDKQNCRPQLGRPRQQAEFIVWGTKGARPNKGKVCRGVIPAAIPRERMHIATKPVTMLAELLAIAEGPVLDPFTGSGSAALAAHSLGHDFIGIEIDKWHFETASKRVRSLL